MCLMLILSGFLFLMIGVIGEYLGKLISTSTNKPLFVVREVKQSQEKAEKEEEGQTEKPENLRQRR